jgi:hypothetical protein
MDNNHETTIHSSFYQVAPIDFPQGENYISDIEFLTMSSNGIIDAQIANMTLNESCMMLINAIKVFQIGFFDCAFYSLRQTIELSLSGIYLSSDKNKIKSWNNWEKGFEKATMIQELKKEDPDYNNIKEELSFYFNELRETQLEIDKYVHKQGFTTFYTYHGRTADYHTKHIRKLQCDFERYLKECIGAVAIYRLVIDPLPLLLMEEDIEMRTPDFITEPFGARFIENYIPEDVVKAYKQTEIYKGYYDDLSKREKQNDAVYALIHWSSINREKLEDYSNQAHLLSFHDKLALIITILSPKVTNCYLMNGCLWYHTENESQRGRFSITFGNDYFQQFFHDDNNYNLPFGNAFISKCFAFGETHYFEHNTPLVQQEIALIENSVFELNKNYEETNKRLQDWFNMQIKNNK